MQKKRFTNNCLCVTVIQLLMFFNQFIAHLSIEKAVTSWRTISNELFFKDKKYKCKCIDNYFNLFYTPCLFL